MTVEHTPEATTDVAQPARQVPSEDWLLESLVASANHSEEEFELPITLMASGCLITGRLIGMSHYFQMYGAWWKTATRDSEEGTETEMFWKEQAELAVNDLREKQTTEFNYIHLKDAHVISGFGMVPAEQGMLWRGRLAHVSGFWLGAIAVVKAPTIQVSTSTSRD